jgi:hypothetical protein
MVPAGWAGDLAVILVAVLVRMVPAIVPNLIAVAPESPVPETVIVVLPVIGPLPGEMPVTFGMETNVNLPAATTALVPPGAVILTSTVPAAWAGDLTRILVGETTVRFVPAIAPKVTAVAPENPLPVMVTSVFPEVDP